MTGFQWQQFIKCENLPNTKDPTSLRSFIFKWSLDNSKFDAEEIIWWLKCEDRSILTQDVDEPDVRRKIIDQKKDSSGKNQNIRVDNFLQVYRSLDKTIDKKKISDSILKDLVIVRKNN